MEQWKERAKPVVLLGTICAIVTSALGITNQLTAPVIAQRLAEASSLVLEELMSDKVFIPADTDAPFVVEAFRSEDNQHFIVTTVLKGYGGMIFATVAFDHDGTITSVVFQGDDESVGIGKKIMDEPFYSQYVGLETSASDFKLQVDNISGATISSIAATEAVSAAIEGFLDISSLSEDEDDEEEVVLSKEEQLRRDFAFLLPEPSTFQEITVDSPSVQEAYAAMDGSGYVLYLAFEGHKGEITIGVSLNNKGSIVNIKVTAHRETNGIGSLVEEREFLNQFQGYTGNEDSVDVISSATRSSSAVIKGATAAIEAFQNLPTVDYGKETDLIHVTEEDRAASAKDNFYEIITYTPEEKEALRQEAIKQMFPLASGYTEIPVEKEQIVDVYQALPNQGYIITATGTGYEESEMTVIVGLNPAGEVVGVRLFELEPSGVEKSFMGHNKFFNQFLSKTENIPEDEVYLVSGATYSSNGLYQVMDIVFELFEALKEGETDHGT